ncbi:uncharacterized protein LOC141846543 [Curcuma longa]|uniref:uncharacterized protein LOC141846543 n=1 Tax=Curcuma longa TaxID=136217 RepID=UPI003D9F2ED7
MIDTPLACAPFGGIFRPDSGWNPTNLSENVTHACSPPLSAPCNASPNIKGRPPLHPSSPLSSPSVDVVVVVVVVGMFPCGGIGSVELLCRLARRLDVVAAKSHVAAVESEASLTLSIRFREIKCKLERLQVKLIKEIFCAEDNVMEQLRPLACCFDELAAAAGDDSQGFPTLKSLEKIEAAVCRALAAVADKDMLLLGNERMEGPWGPRLGFQWDIGAFHDIKTINVSADDRINSIRIEYKFNRKEYKTPRIGGEGGTLHQIELGEKEHIASVRGIYDTISLTKLEIVTNKNSYSFGKGCGGSVFPATQLEGCSYRVVGFFGRAASYVNAIGVYLEKINVDCQSEDNSNKRRCVCSCPSETSTCFVC